MKNGKKYPATITIEGMFGDREVNKKEFVRQWVDHVKQYISITQSVEDMNCVMSMRNKVDAMASREFDRLLALRSTQEKIS